MMRHILGWIESHAGLASWVQAAGAIVALALTVYIAYDSSAQSERQASEAAKAWAIHFKSSLDIHIEESKQGFIPDRKVERGMIQIQGLYAVSQIMTADRLPPEKIESYIMLRLAAMEFTDLSMSFTSQSKDDRQIMERYQHDFELIKAKTDLAFAIIID